MTISVREFGMPMTVSRNSLSTNIREPSTSRAQPDERRLHRVEVHDGDPNMVETSNV
jgi:hypothetical protein